MNETKTTTTHLSFRVQGEFITQFAKQKLQEDHDLAYALRILGDCLRTEDTDYANEKRLLNCLLILNDKAEIRGTYPDDDYRLVIFDDSKDYNIFNELIECLQKCYASDNPTLQSKYNDLLQRYSFVLDYLDLPRYKQLDMNKQYQNEYDTTLFDLPDDRHNTHMNQMLQSYINRQKNSTPDEEDYGWLSPTGVFYGVEWGEHGKWAMDYLMEHYPYNAENKELYMHNGNRINDGDVLVYNLHWVLLHNPAQGVATPQYDHTRQLTKAQKEFLYEYYIKRNEHERANQIWSEE